MKYRNIRIVVNALIAIFIFLFKLILRKRRKITYFDVNTGVAEYKTTYYVLLFIPVFWRKERIPRLKEYVGKDK